ncbi:MAG: hypothetical protein LBV21_04990 [Candidatus Adiutrix sp.]|jgi:fermentation-respiration switch protein FrsA (DUF1100 family)|nr:hypothetical protein [Candidatus Adiutrix sp.]
MTVTKSGRSLRGLVFRLLLSAFFALTGLAALLVTRLRHPLAADLLKAWREPSPYSDCLLKEPEAILMPLLKNQFQIDLFGGALALLGGIMLIYYRRRLGPLLLRLEELGLDRW